MLDIQVLLIDTNNVSLEHLLKSHYLFHHDVESLSKYKVEETKKEKAASLILKNKYIVEYSLNEHGKPVSDKCFFNISHSHGVVVLVKDTLPVGIDIEKIRDVKPNLVDYISSFEEKKYIKSNKNFFEIWTNKEALTKAIGTGVTGHVKDIPALPINGEKQYLDRFFYVKTIEHNGFIISLIRESKEAFNIVIEEVKIF